MTRTSFGSVTTCSTAGRRVTSEFKKTHPDSKLPTTTQKIHFFTVKLLKKTINTLNTENIFYHILLKLSRNYHVTAHWACNVHGMTTSSPNPFSAMQRRGGTRLSPLRIVERGQGWGGFEAMTVAFPVSTYLAEIWQKSKNSILQYRLYEAYRPSSIRTLSQVATSAIFLFSIFLEHFLWCSMAITFHESPIQFCFHGGNKFLWIFRNIASFRNIFSNMFIRIFNTSFFPRVVRMTKEYSYR